MVEEKKTITIDDQKAKRISGFDNGYYISEQGELFSSKKTRCKKVGKYYKPSGSVHANGYRYFTLMKSGKSVKAPAHRLVAQEFIKNPFSKKCVNHIDGDKLNNMVENLEWVTHSENSLHAFDTGLMVASSRKAIESSARSRSKITKENAVKIINTVSENPRMTYKEVGALFGCKENTIHRIVTGKQKYFREAV